MEFRAHGSNAGKMHQPHNPYRGDKHDLAELKKSLAHCLSHTDKEAFDPQEIIKKS